LFDGHWGKSIVAQAFRPVLVLRKKNRPEGRPEGLRYGRAKILPLPLTYFVKEFIHVDPPVLIPLDDFLRMIEIIKQGWMFLATQVKRAGGEVVGTPSPQRGRPE
jgi:hypothetical protein